MSAAIGAVLMLGAASASAVTPSVGQTAASWTPHLLSDPVYQTVRRLVPCGGLMYAVGTLSTIGQGNNTYTRGNAFSFSATDGTMTNWDPQANAPVNDITFNPDCSVAYLAGNFTSIRGVTASHIAAVDTSTGNLITTFKHSAAANAFTADYTHGQVIFGGAFRTINGVARTELASLDPTTGTVTSYVNLNVDGAYQNTSKHVDNSQLSHSGSKLLIEGVFTSIAGQPRQQMAVLDLDGASVTLDPWDSPELDKQVCNSNETYFNRAGAWSPDDNTIYGASTGYKPPTGPGSNTSLPRAGLCDAAYSFSAAPGSQQHKWINYTGCDSYYAVVADDTQVYVAGHERWANNPLACDRAGTGALSRPGIGSLNVSDGQATPWNPTRSLGHGADDLVLTSAGLWVASDTFKQGNAQMCAGKWNHGGICFLPY
ncbi:MAG TPA: hypothetical protein VGH43_00035 [Jatrophihabitans sp.]|jgi:hypothetical protein